MADDRMKFQFLFMSRGGKNEQRSVQSKESITRHFSLHCSRLSPSVCHRIPHSKNYSSFALFKSVRLAGSKVISLISHALENEDRKMENVSAQEFLSPSKSPLELNCRNFWSYCPLKMLANWVGEKQIKTNVTGANMWKSQNKRYKCELVAMRMRQNGDLRWQLQTFNIRKPPQINCCELKRTRERCKKTLFRSQNENHKLSENLFSSTA